MKDDSGRCAVEGDGILAGRCAEGGAVDRDCGADWTRRRREPDQAQRRGTVTRNRENVSDRIVGIDSRITGGVSDSYKPSKLIVNVRDAALRACAHHAKAESKEGSHYEEKETMTKQFN